MGYPYFRKPPLVHVCVDIFLIDLTKACTHLSPTMKLANWRISRTPARMVTQKTSRPLLRLVAHVQVWLVTSDISISTTFNQHSNPNSAQAK
jgi:hypothetical protein